MQTDNVLVALKYDQKLIKGALSGLRQIITTEIPSKVMRNTFSFTLEGLSVLKMFKFLSWLFGHLENLLSITVER